MKAKVIFVLYFLCLLSSKSTAQISAFTTYQNQFMVWQDGMVRKIDYLTPISYKIGRMAMPYIDNSRSLKIYHGGGVTKITDGLTSQYAASDNLVTYQNASLLSVWDRGKTTLLSRYCQQYYTGDSVVFFFEGVQKEFKAYYDGRVFPVESYLAAGNVDNLFDSVSTITNEMDIASGALPSIKVSDNIAAYINYANQFHAFFRGEIVPLEDYTVASFDVGRNTVGYVDNMRQFKIFHDGQTTTIDNFPPLSYAVGDNVAAFVGYDNYFKIYYRDSVYNIGYFQPSFQVADNMVCFDDATGYFKVFYKGKIYTLENYYPANYTAAYNSVAYINRAGVLRLFSEGNIYDVTNADISDWRLDYDVVQYKFGGNMYKIFYQGKTY
ncbi:MAG: hypothetical protein QM642_10160 [Edaphocola sp.]